MATNNWTMTKAPKGRISKLFNAVAWCWGAKVNSHPHLLATMVINHRTCTPLCFCNKIVSRLIIKINFLTLTEEKCEAREFMEWTCTTSAPASPWGRINHPTKTTAIFAPVVPQFIRKTSRNRDSGTGNGRVNIKRGYRESDSLWNKYPVLYCMSCMLTRTSEHAPMRCRWTK